MMSRLPQLIHSLVIPHKRNSHRAYLLRHPVLVLFFTALFSFQVILNVFYSSNPKILGFATNIYQQDLIKLVNQKRLKAGLPVLKENPALDKAAMRKGQDMLSHNYWAHVSPTGVTPWYWFEKESYNYLIAGENLARDFNTSAGVVAGWMASPSHKENIVNPEFTEIGMAVLNGKLLGEDTTLVVQFFGEPQPPVLAVSQKVDQSGAGKAVGLAYAAAPEETVAPQKKLPESITAVVAEGGKLQPLGLPADTFSAFDRLNLTFNQFTNSGTWGGGQKVLILAFAFLIMLLVVDSIAHFRRGLVRKSSHSVLHAGILVILTLTIIYSNFGLVL